MADGKKFGEWAFIAGIIAAIIIGLFSANLKGSVWEGYLVLVLVIAGLVVGLLNISEKEATGFLIAAVVLLSTSTAAEQLSLIKLGNFVLGNYFAGVVKQIGVFIAPAAIIVALQSIYRLAKD